MIAKIIAAAATAGRRWSLRRRCGDTVIIEGGATNKSSFRIAERPRWWAVTSWTNLGRHWMDDRRLPPVTVADHHRDRSGRRAIEASRSGEP